MSESIIVYLRRRLNDVGPRQWPAIQAATGVSANLMRKVAYGDRTNPRLQTIEPLLEFFKREEARDAA